LPLSPDTLVVDCSASAIPQRPLVPIWDGKRITLQMVRTCQPTFSAALIAHIEATFGFVRLFPVRVYSCRVGASKPGPVIYHHALRELLALPEETLCIDDLRENVDAAVQLGMTGFHFTSPGELLSEFSRLGLWV